MFWLAERCAKLVMSRDQLVSLQLPLDFAWIVLQYIFGSGFTYYCHIRSDGEQRRDWVARRDQHALCAEDPTPCEKGDSKSSSTPLP